MVDGPAAPTRPDPARADPVLRRAHLVTAVGLAVLVLVQAAMAGQWLADGGLDIELHGYVGNATFLVGVIGAALAFLARAPRWSAVLAILVAVLLVAQTGLGYLGREEPAAVAWHIPLGVAVFGLVAAQVAGLLAVRDRA